MPIFANQQRNNMRILLVYENVIIQTFVKVFLALIAIVTVLTAKVVRYLKNSTTNRITSYKQHCHNRH